MTLAASIQITDQDVYTASLNKGAEVHGQYATTPDGRSFAYANAGAVNLAAGKLTQTTASTANYATRTLTTAAAAGSMQVIVPLGATAAQNLFGGYWLVVTDGTGAGQGAYKITGNSAATSGNSNTTTVQLQQALNVALDTTSVVGIYPNQYSTVVVSDHTAAPAIPISGVPNVAVTASYFFWNQTGGFASVLSDDTSVVSKNAGGIASNTVDGAVEIEVAGTLTRRIGYAPELMIASKYSPFVLTLDY